MKSVVLVFLLSYCCALHGNAQQVIYYSKRHKAMEGSWTCVKDGEAQMNAMIDKMAKQQYDVYDDPESAFYTPAQSGMLCEGVLTTWYPNGNMAKRCIYEKGIPKGTYERWSYYGNKEVTGTFTNGKPDGLWTFYYPNGKVMMRVKYIGDQPSGHVYPKPQNGAHWPPAKQEALSGAVSYGFGNPLRWIGYRNTPDGDVNVYTENGDLNMQMHFDAGMRTGTWLYLQNGRKIAEIKYDNDTVVSFYDRNRHNVADDSKMLASAGLNELFYYRPRTAPSDLNAPVSDNELPYHNVQVRPMYPGGDSAMQVFIKEHRVFPEEDKKVKKEGNVAIEFVVATDGHLKDVKIANGLGYGCDEEALRLVNAMPNWKPATQNGIAVPVYYKIVVPFMLKDE